MVMKPRVKPKVKISLPNRKTWSTRVVLDAVVTAAPARQYKIFLKNTLSEYKYKMCFLRNHTHALLFYLGGASSKDAAVLRIARTIPP